MRWTNKDKKRVRDIIDLIASRTEGGKAGMARSLDLKSRAVLNNWRTRGRIPMQYHGLIIKHARPTVVTSEMLDPNVRAVSAMKNRLPSITDPIGERV